MWRAAITAARAIIEADNIEALARSMGDSTL
jgi:hypothetical protein